MTDMPQLEVSAQRANVRRQYRRRRQQRRGPAAVPRRAVLCAPALRSPLALRMLPALRLPLALRMPLALWLVLACSAAMAPAIAKAAPESIQIFRPLDASQAVFIENDGGLLIVPGGRMFLLQLEISALNPLLEVRINGRTYSTPRTSWTFIKKPQFLKRGMNKIVVEARTNSGRATQEFIIELRPLPGFHPKPSKPAS